MAPSASGHLSFGRPTRLLRLGFQMDHPERRDEIEHRRDRRGERDVAVRNVQVLRHDEGDRPHHRRHDLPAHAGGRFDRAREGRAVAETLHQRDGELAGRDDVRHAGAVDRAHQRRRDDRDLRRTARVVADGAHRDVVEQADHARLLEERSEQDEQEDERGGDLDRRAVDAFDAAIHLVEDQVEIVSAMAIGIRDVLAQEEIDEERAAHERQRHSHHAARRLEHQHDDRRADNHVERVGVRARHQVDIEDPVVEAEREGADGDQPVMQRHALVRPAAARAEQHEHHEEQEAHMHRAHDDARQRAEGRRVDLEERESHAHPVGDPARHAVEQRDMIGQRLLDLAEFFFG